jgi:hypothetical protein
MRALSRRVRHDAIDADRRQYQRQTGKEQQQAQREPSLGCGIGEQCFHRHHAKDRLLRIDVVDRLSQGSCKPLGRSLGASDERHLLAGPA